MRKIISLALIFTLTALACACLCSCEKKRPASDMMRDFCAELGLRGTVFSPDVPEGESGYVSGDFFSSLYGESDEYAADFAVVLLSDLEYAAECGVFICYSDVDAVRVTDMLHRRIELMRSVAAVSGLRFPEDAFVYREGRAVVMCALHGAPNARALWRAIL